MTRARRSVIPNNKPDWDGLQAGFYDFLGHVTIVSKDEGRIRLEMYDAQRYFFDEIFDGLRRDIHWFVCGKGRQLGICLDPKTRVLTADLRWVYIGELTPGTEIISVDEHSEGPHCGRKMRGAVVAAVVRVHRPAYRITFDDGRSLICTGQHPWLSRKNDPAWKWRSIEKPFRDLNQGRSEGLLEVGTKIRWATRAPWPDGDIEDGWFGGMLDGEGHISNEKRSGVQISVSQRYGPVWDRLVKYCADRGYHYWVQEDNDPERESKYGKNPVPQLEIRRLDEAFQLVGQTRPMRFLNRRFWENRELPGKRNQDGVGYATITSIEFVGERDLVDLQTSRGTYIAEGFVSHNTTACLLFDVFYAGAVPDVQAGFVVDTDSNKQKFRKILKEMITTLPASHRLPIAKGGDNREGLTLENGNMLDYLTAGTKRGQGTLGRSRALNFVHATECRSYGDEEALESFKDSLSEIFPWRLYLWESTGYGYNLFYDLWEDAVADELTKMAIFVSWWRKRTYSYRRGTPLFQRYGWKDRSKEEREAEDIVLASYGHKITDEQWAWYRHRADPIARAEERNDEDMADDRQEIVTQEHPHFPDQMFRGTGSPFIPNEYIAPALHRAQNLIFRGYRYHLGDTVSAMTIVPTKFLKFAQLKVYEPPSPIGRYIVGVDTAYGISDRGDANCIEVVRCFADKMVQVAEFNDRSVQPFQVAWVLLHLCGWYGNCRYVLELNGSGEAVWTELKTLKRMVEEGRITPPRFAPEDLMEPLPNTDDQQHPTNDIRHAYQHVTQYLYRRSDSLGGGGYNYHMRTSIESKFTYMTQFADRFMLDEFTINSVPALEEMKRMRKDGRSIEAEGKAKDDRPIALGLVTRAYIDDERKNLVASNQTYAAEMQREADGAGNDSLAARYMGLIMQQTMAAKGQARRRTERAGRRQRWGW